MDKAIGKVTEIAIGKAKIVDIDDRRIAVFRVKDREFCAIDNQCPHAGGSLGEGHLEGYEVTCPWHAWDFNVRTGACGMVPADRIRAYKVKVEGDDILLHID